MTTKGLSCLSRLPVELLKTPLRVTTDKSVVFFLIHFILQSLFLSQCPHTVLNQQAHETLYIYYAHIHTSV